MQCKYRNNKRHKNKNKRKLIKRNNNFNNVINVNIKQSFKKPEKNNYVKYNNIVLIDLWT